MSNFEMVVILLLASIAAYMLSLPFPHERTGTPATEANARPQNRVVRCWQAACKALKLRRD